jgi:hypothetical protein
VTNYGVTRRRAKEVSKNQSHRSQKSEGSKKQKSKAGDRPASPRLWLLISEVLACFIPAFCPTVCFEQKYRIGRIAFMVFEEHHGQVMYSTRGTYGTER